MRLQTRPPLLTYLLTSPGGQCSGPLSLSSSSSSLSGHLPRPPVPNAPAAPHPPFLTLFFDSFHYDSLILLGAFPLGMILLMDATLALTLVICTQPLRLLQ